MTKAFREMTDVEKASSSDPAIVERYYAEIGAKIRKDQARRTQEMVKKYGRGYYLPNTRLEISALLRAIEGHASLKGWEKDEHGDYDGYIEVTPGWGMTLDDLEAILSSLNMRISINAYVEPED